MAASLVPLIAISVWLTFMIGCGDAPEDRHNSGHVHAQPANQSSSQPKEKFFRGDVVVHKSDQRHGVIIGKHYIANPNHSGGPHDCWLYEVRFASKEPNSPLQLVDDVGEFELDKVENK